MTGPLSPRGYGARIAAVSVLYFASAKGGLSLAWENPSATPIWAPTGIALAAIVLGGYRMWPAVAVGAFLANITTQGPLGSVLGITVGNTSEALVGAYLLRRVGFRPSLERTRDVLALATLAAFLSTLVSATIGVTSLWLADTVAAGTFWSVWRTWWLGDAGGDLIVAPALFFAASLWAGTASRPRRRQASELAALVALLAGLGVLVLSTRTQLAYVLFPFLFWIALRYRQLGAVAASLTLSGLAIYFVARGRGPFAGGSPDSELLRAQMFGGVAAVTALLAAAVRTERARAEEELGASEVAREALARSEAALAEAQRIAHIGSWEWDIAEDVVRWTDELYRMYGISAEEFRPSYAGFLERVHPADRAMIEATVQRGYETGESFGFEHRIVRPDGSERILLARGVVEVAGGRAVRMSGTAQDITEDKAAEEERRRGEERFRALLEAAPDGVLITDAEGRIILVNAQTEALFGYARAELLLQPVEMLLPERLRAVHVGHRRRYHTSPRTRPMGMELELSGRRKDGSEFAVEISLSPLPTETGLLVTSIIRDVSERKQAEEERRRFESKLQEAQRLESLGVLAGGIAHDFNNLLVGVLGGAGLALGELPADSPARPKVQQIETAALRAAELTKAMLAYAGRGTFVVQALDLSEAVKEIAYLLERSISKSAFLDFHLAPDLPAVSADKAQLHQLVMNLITNASDALGEESGVIGITTRAVYADRRYLAENFGAHDLREGAYLCLEVSDTGCGMDAETQERIFDPFFTTKARGRGLGLASVLGIVRGHGGAINVSSEPGRGTTITVLFPASVEAPVPAAEPAAAAEWKGAGTFLVVDDEALVQALSATILEKAGFTVLTASDGGEALDIIGERGQAVVGVLLDLTMPGRRGTETLQELRRLRADLPVVLMSGYSEQDVTDLVRGESLVGFLQKPFRAEELIERVRQVLERPAHDR
jgi:PAS domain S-box-containing protein